ncbi:MAG TPA: Gfo/Idh/MocA family oxidoreductase [Patescibacteria group bacterium]|nr:Gfo/Idh/MocA family oxidoreductase [Patescibacteria group bacterium]
MKQIDSARFGLVGIGHIGRAYVKAFSSCSVAQLVGVVDIDARAAREAALRAGCSVFDDIRALADPTLIDAVVVCTPPSTHAAISCYFLERGIHVLCEKPLALDGAAARSMLEVAAHHGVILTMASKFRFVDDVIRAKSIAASGIIGEVVLFENSFTSHVDMSARWNSDPAISGGGVLIDNGTHSVDLMRYFLGSVAEVQAIEGRRLQRLPVEDTVRLIVRTGTGVMGTIDLSWSIQKDQDEYISLYGTRGTIHVGWHASKYRGLASGEWIVFGDGYDKLRALGAQLDNFARALLGEEQLMITPEDALASVEVIASAYDAMRVSRWVAIGAIGPWPEEPPLAATGTGA